MWTPPRDGHKDLGKMDTAPAGYHCIAMFRHHRWKVTSLSSYNGPVCFVIRVLYVNHFRPRESILALWPVVFFTAYKQHPPPPEKSLEICTKYYFWVKGEVIEAWLTPEETYTTRKLLYLFSRAWSVCVLYYGHFLLSIPWLLCNYWKYPHTTKLRVWPKVEGQRHWRFLKMLLPPNP